MYNGKAFRAGEARFKRSCRAKRSLEGEGDEARLAVNPAIDAANEELASRLNLYEDGETGGLEGSVPVELAGEAACQSCHKHAMNEALRTVDPVLSLLGSLDHVPESAALLVAERSPLDRWLTRPSSCPVFVHRLFRLRQ